MRRTLGCIFFSACQLTIQAAPAHAEEYVTIFHYNENHLPVTKFDQLPALTPGLKALFALYTLENGAGCEGKDESGLVKCDMTEKLELGSNCSAAHIKLVRSWFDVTPNLTSRWNKRWNANTKTSGTLENLCYGQPDTASWQNKWKIIRVKMEGSIVEVEAVLFWGSQYGHGKVRYRNSYKIDSHTIIETSSETHVLSESTKSMFVGEGK